MGEAILKIENLETVYKMDRETVCAVNGISFSLNKGETIGLVGETGAGKTTTALSIMRLMPEKTGIVKGGKVLFHGEDLLTLKEIEMQRIRGESIAIIFQDPMTSLNPLITIGDQIAEALTLHNHDNKSSETIEKRVNEVLTMVGIPSCRKTDYPHQLSGGMKQRIVIAMALACEPELIIADEPTTALDVTIQAQAIQMIRELRERMGTSMIMITHDLGIVAQTCDNVAVMYAGRIVEMGSLEDIFCGKRHHPYTEGLFGSIPDMYKKTRRLMPIPGLMPDPTKLSPGCSFEPRCPFRMDCCKTLLPDAIKWGTHQICCHRFDNATNGGEE